MKLDSVLELKSEVLKNLRKKETQRRSAAQTENLVNPYVQNRIAVGYSATDRNQYQLELRVQREVGPAFRQAEEIKAKARGEANIEIIPYVGIPTKAEILDASVFRNFGKDKRPLHIGASVGHSDDGPGTLGAFVEIDGGVAILSNSHVLARSGQANKNDWIYQPGREPGRALSADDRVARLRNFVELSRVERNETDSAIALLNDDVEHDSNQIPKGFDFPDEGKLIRHLPGDPDLFQPNKPVCKIGRTTGWREGILTAIGLDGLTVNTRIGNVIFDNVLEVTWTDKSFSEPGDSGSLIYTRGELAALGLHFAAGPKGTGRKRTTVSYSCRLELILKTYEATLLD